MNSSLSSPPSSNTLFVTGNSSVGNQFLHSLLTADPQVVMGLGRFNKNSQGDQTLFTKDQFAGFHLGEGAGQSVSNAQISKAQLESAKLIWDIHPSFFLGYDSLIRLFPGARVVVLLQNILDICYTNDSGISLFNATSVSEQSTIESKVALWNQMLQFIVTHLTEPNIKVVVYEELISNIQNYRELYQFLGLSSPKDDDLFFLKSVQRANQLEAAGRVEIAAKDKLKILKNADFALYQSILNSKQELKLSKDLTNSAPGSQTTVPKIQSSDNSSNSPDKLTSNEVPSAPLSDSQHIDNPNLLPPLRMSEQDVIAAQRIFLSEEILTSDEIHMLVGKDSFYLQSYLMNTKAFKNNPYNFALITSIAKEIAIGIKSRGQ